MVLSTSDLIAALQHEVRVACHLVSKIDPAKLDYRPTPGQRSTLEVAQYLGMMGPMLTASIVGKGFDVDAWTAAAKAATARGLGATLEALAAQEAWYGERLSRVSEADMGVRVEMFGTVARRGVHLVNMVLSGHAAYRMQLFLYLKASGQPELNSSNLWAGVDVEG